MNSTPPCADHKIVKGDIKASTLGEDSKHFLGRLGPAGDYLGRLSREVRGNF